MADPKGLARWKAWAFFVSCLCVTMAVIGMLKLVADAPRPLDVFGPAIHVVGVPQHGHSFPSGHAALASMLAALCWKRSTTLSKVGLCGLVVAMMYSRVVMGAHFPLDVVCGAALGMISPTLTKHLTSLALEGTLAKRVAK